MKPTPDSSWHRAPKALRKTHIHLDNVALVPASELASLAKWQARANTLPIDHTLIVLPTENAHLLKVGRRICRSLKERGLGSTIATVR